MLPYDQQPKNWFELDYYCKCKGKSSCELSIANVDFRKKFADFNTKEKWFNQEGNELAEFKQYWTFTDEAKGELFERW